MTVIQIIGSSTAFGAGVASKEKYLSFLEEKFRSCRFELIAHRAKTSHALGDLVIQFPDDDSDLICILHFLADEILRVNRTLDSVSVVRKILKFYETYKMNSELKISLHRRVNVFALQFLLFCIKVLVPVVSGRQQLENYRNFFKMHGSYRCIIVIVDSRRTFLAPVIPTLLRKIRSIRINLLISQFENVICLDYSQLKLTRNHFQSDGTHLNSDGHNILALGLGKIIGDID
jgi:hypothetical protein